jgi:hypothetical protein
MVLLGVDPHKDTHTVVAVDHAGRQLDQTTVAARTPTTVSGRWRTAATSPGGWNATCWPLGSGWCGSHRG